MFVEAANFCIDFVTEAKAYYEPIVEMHNNKATSSKTAKDDRPKHAQHAANYQAKLDNLLMYYCISVYKFRKKIYMVENIYFFFLKIKTIIFY
jgi:hypothetical protein